MSSFSLWSRFSLNEHKSKEVHFTSDQGNMVSVVAAAAIMAHMKVCSLNGNNSGSIGWSKIETAFIAFPYLPASFDSPSYERYRQQWHFIHMGTQHTHTHTHVRSRQSAGSLIKGIKYRLILSTLDFSSSISTQKFLWCSCWKRPHSVRSGALCMSPWSFPFVLIHSFSSANCIR